MGAVNKIPGVSGGTVAFVTGIYEDLLNSIKRINFNAFKILFAKGFKAFYEEINGKFLTIVFSGVVASFFSVSLILDSLIEKYELYVFGLFFGMIVGSCSEATTVAYGEWTCRKARTLGKAACTAP